ncbi:MAG: hypothetical protein Q7R62_00580 [bacterium]|nr:hypothetical protein [bacterium]
MNSEIRNCQNCKQNFTIEPEDFDFYQKIDVPPPTFCPDCRLQRRMMFRNERALYNRKCDLCGAGIIAMYSPDKPFKVYCPKCFYSDKWDPMKYGRPYDPAKSFFAQMKELMQEVPHLSLLQENAINSPWINYELDSKNCYLNFGGQYNEDSAYNQYALKAKDSFDNFWPMAGQFIYETTVAENGYKIFFSKLCFDCRETYFSFDCRNCVYVIGCTGLRHKQYHIFNKPVSKEEFERFLKDNLGSRTKVNALKKKAQEFFRSQPQRALFIDRSVDSTGNMLESCKNCKECWNTSKTEDSKWQFYSLEGRDSYDVFSVWKGERCYDILGGSEAFNVRFTLGSLRQTSDVEYCYFAMNIHNSFGCVNLRNKKHCILNMQYTEMEYKKLRAEIIASMDENPYVDSKGRTFTYGGFFPYDLSLFGYNETVADEFFPLTYEEIRERGFNLGTFEADQQSPSDYEVPDSIDVVRDDILQKVLRCKASGKVFRIIPMELQFYRRFNLPIPEYAPFERHHQRLQFISDHINLLERICGKCNKIIQSIYSELEFPIVYCDDCYHHYVA